MKTILLTIPVLAGGVMGAEATGTPATAEPKDIVSTAVAAGSFDTLAAALEAADLVGTLQGEGPFTVFAPTDEAFAKLPAGTVEMLLKPENKDLLRAVLLYHVVPGKLAAGDVVAAPFLTSVQGQRIPVMTKGGKVRVDDAQVVKTGVACTNGVIHVIDSVILPTTDDLIDLAMNHGKFETLVAAVQAAGLVEALKAEGPYTVFAPSDAAFAKLPKGTVEELVKPENRDKLTRILTYHVVPGRVMLGDALNAGSAATLQGSKLTFRYADGAARVGKARIVAADVEAANGVIHVIDTVLLPE